MAVKKAVEGDYSMQEKIIALYELQKIDSQIDEINKIKGELPLEVKDLEDRIEGIKTRLENIEGEIEHLHGLTLQREREIDTAQIEIRKYKEQHNNVRNNREWDAINKEIDYKELEIKLAQKRLGEYSSTKTEKQNHLDRTKSELKDQEAELVLKRSELSNIEEQTADRVKELRSRGEISKGRIDARLLSAYNRIRGNVRNGLAVVTVNRDACGGCFNRIPPQRQVEIRHGKRIIVCEYCGRILVFDPSQQDDE